MLTREEVYAALDSERNYQDEAKHGNATHTRPFVSSVLSGGEIILLCEHALNQARTEFYIAGGDPAPYLRKVAALIVQFGERFGLPPRKGY